MKAYAIYLDFIGQSRMVRPNQECPNALAHTECPEGYVDWHEWAEAMTETHEQVRCDGCGLLNIWAPTETTTSDRRADA